MFESDRDYFYRRAEDELERAQVATTAAAVQAHSDLAERYLALIDELDGCEAGGTSLAEEQAHHQAANPRRTDWRSPPMHFFRN